MRSMYTNQRALFHGLRSGCADAVDYWYRQYRPKLVGYMRSRVASSKDVDELVQEVFISCLKDLPLFRGESGLLTWMYSVARHEVADYYRKKYAKKAIKALPLSDLVLAHTPLDSHETAEKVKQVISRLTAKHQELLLLKYIDGKRVEEIAEELGRSVKAIESDLFRARRAFRELYVSLP